MTPTVVIAFLVGVLVGMVIVAVVAIRREEP